MSHVKKITVAFVLVAFMIAGIAATMPPKEEHPHQNLKILPKNISHEDLDKIMDEFKAALGVKCNFCHAASKDSSSKKLDFASDEKPEKNIAREMMRMTNKINKKYFNYEKDDKGEHVPVVFCATCHRGNPHPEVK
jgi:hypothetical protein